MLKSKNLLGIIIFILYCLSINLIAQNRNASVFERLHSREQAAGSQRSDKEQINAKDQLRRLFSSHILPKN